MNTCDTCGYLLHPGMRNRCPECGADPAHVPQRRQLSPAPSSPLQAAALAAVVIGVPLSALVPALVRSTPSKEPRPFVFGCLALLGIGAVVRALHRTWCREERGDIARGFVVGAAAGLSVALVRTVFL